MYQMSTARIVVEGLVWTLIYVSVAVLVTCVTVYLVVPDKKPSSNIIVLNGNFEIQLDDHVKIVTNQITIRSK